MLNLSNRAASQLAFLLSPHECAGPTYLALLWWFAMNDPDIDARAHLNWAEARITFMYQTTMWWLEGVSVAA